MSEDIKNYGDFNPSGILINTLQTPAFRLPEGATKEAACSLLRTLSEGLTAVALPDGLLLRVHHILRDADESGSAFRFATQFQLTPKQ